MQIGEVCKSAIPGTGKKVEVTQDIAIQDIALNIMYSGD